MPIEEELIAVTDGDGTRRAGIGVYGPGTVQAESSGETVRGRVQGVFHEGVGVCERKPLSDPRAVERLPRPAPAHERAQRHFSLA